MQLEFYFFVFIFRKSRALSDLEKAAMITITAAGRAERQRLMSLLRGRNGINRPKLRLIN